MEVPENPGVETEKRTGLGRCRHFFWLGVVFDTVGAAVLLTGVFANLLYSDLMLYLGSILIFLSLLWWVFWYTGNIELTSEDAFRRPFRVSSAGTVEHRLQRAVSRLHCFGIRKVSTNFLQTRQQRLQSLRGTHSGKDLLSMAVGGRVETELDREEQKRDAKKSDQESSDAQDVCRETLGPEPAAVASSAAAGAPGPDALGSNASQPRFPEPPATHSMQPESVPSTPDQSLPPASVSPQGLLTAPFVSALSVSQPPALGTCKSQLGLSTSSSHPHAPLASTSCSAHSLATVGQPLPILSSSSLPAHPLSSQSLPLVIHPCKSQPAVSEAFQSQVQAPVASESPPQAPQSQHQNLSPVIQTEPSPDQDSPRQDTTAPVSVL